MEETLNTEKGEVVLVRDLSADRLAALEMGAGLGVFFHYRYEDAHRTRDVLAEVCERADDCLNCAINGDVLIGYCTIVGPCPDSRWAAINDELVGKPQDATPALLLELGSIEISAAWRSLGLARALLDFTFREPLFEQRIVFSRELSWHWDLRSSNLTIYEYRTLLLGLFEQVGFRYCETDDEEIAYAGENMLMARVGRLVPPETALRFYRSLCRSEPRGWGWG